MAPIGRLQAIEVWTAPVCVGTRVCTIAGYRDARSVHSIDNDDSCSFVIELTNDANVELIEGRVLVYVYAPLTPGGTVSFDEFYLTSIERAHEYGAGAIRVGGRSLILALSRSGALWQVTNGVPSYAFSDSRTITEWIDTYLLPCLTARGFAFVARGTVDFSATYTLALDKTTGLDLLHQLAALTLGEFRLRRNGTTDYKLDFVTAINASAASVYLHAGRSLLSARVASDAATEKFATRLLPIGSLGSDASNCTIARARWKVTALDGANKDITLASPDGDSAIKCVRFDGQFTTNAGLSSSYYIVCVRTARPFQLTNSYAATQKVRVASLGDLVVGDFVEFRADQTSLVRTDYNHIAGSVGDRRSGYVSGIAGNDVTLSDMWGEDPVQTDDEWNGLRVEALYQSASGTLTAGSTNVGGGEATQTVSSTTGVSVGDMFVYSGADNAGPPYTIPASYYVYDVTEVVSATVLKLRYRAVTLGIRYDSHVWTHGVTATEYWRTFRARTNVTAFVTDSVASTNVVTLDSVTNIATNDILLFYRMDGGTRLVTLPSSTVATYGEVERTYTRGDLRGEVNLLGASNPYFDDYATAASAPDLYTVVSGAFRRSTTLPGPGSVYSCESNNVSNTMRLQDAYAARILPDTNGGAVAFRARVRLPNPASWTGGQSTSWSLVTAAGPFYASRPTLGGVTVTDTTNPTGGVDVEMSLAIDLSAVDWRYLNLVLRQGIVAQWACSTLTGFCGGLSLIQSTSSGEAGFFVKSQHANTLWNEAGIKLELVDDPPRTYALGVYDLARIDPSGASADALDVGVTVIAEDAALFGTAPPSQRIVRINADHSYPARSSIEVDRLPERITTTLAELLNA